MTQNTFVTKLWQMFSEDKLQASKNRNHWVISETYNQKKVIVRRKSFSKDVCY